jgi:hypothetical protein
VSTLDATKDLILTRIFAMALCLMNECWQSQRARLSSQTESRSSDDIRDDGHLDGRVLARSMGSIVEPDGE